MDESRSLDSFYAAIPAFESFGQVMDPRHYHDVPDDWSVVITDVRSSTRAIEEGRYKDVNSIGVASIVAVRNACSQPDIPFVFGGDGATILIPNSDVKSCERALRGLKRRAKDAFDLDLRIGIVPCLELNENGHFLRVARFQVSRDIAIAMMNGDGCIVADEWIKSVTEGLRFEVSENGPATQNFAGFECRWKPIQSLHGQVVSLLIQPRDPNDRAELEGLVQELSRYVEELHCRPVVEESLVLSEDSAAYDEEVRLKAGKRKGWSYRAKSLQITWINKVGNWLMSHGRDAFGFPGSVYKTQVVLNSDYRKFDGTLRMILDVSPDILETIKNRLEEYRARGIIDYGYYCSNASMMTCVIDSHDGQHVHFIDGADGGYALAAKMLKAQLSSSEVASPQPG